MSNNDFTHSKYVDIPSETFPEFVRNPFKRVSIAILNHDADPPIPILQYQNIPSSYEISIAFSNLTATPLYCKLDRQQTYEIYNEAMMEYKTGLMSIFTKTRTIHQIFRDLEKRRSSTSPIYRLRFYLHLLQ